MSIIKNYSYNLLYQITALIVPFVTIPYISRVFGADGIGSYAVSYAIAQYFCLFGLLGLNTYGTRQIAYCRDNERECRKTFWNLNYMRAITMGIALAIYIIYIVCCMEKAKHMIYICQSLVLWASFFDISWYFYGKEDFKLTALRNIAVKVIGMILVFVFVRDKEDVWLYAFIIALTLLVGQLIMWSIPLKSMKFERPDFKLIKHYFRSTIKLWIPAIAINIYTSLDKVMLGYITTDTQAGLYENSQHLVKFISTITTTLSIVLTPRMSNLFAKKEMDKLREEVYKAFRFVSLLAFPMVFGIIAVRKTFVPWFFGNGFEDVSTLLVVSAWLVLTLSWSNIIGNQILIACGKEKYYTISVSTGAAVNICMNIILIPSLYCMGAIISSVIAEYTGMLMMVYFSRKIIAIKQLLQGQITYLYISFLMFLFTFYLGEYIGHNILSTLTQILFASVFYCGMLNMVKDSFWIDFIKNHIIKIIRKDEYR